MDREGYDLFIVTPEEELTEWEKAIDAIYESCGVKELQVKKKAAELLELAEKELEEKVPEMEFIPIENTLEYKAGFRAGKAESMKDLPRWRDNWDSLRPYKDISGLQYIVLNGKAMNVSDLSKLPGFKED